MVEQLRRSQEIGMNGEDVHSPQAGVVRNLDRPATVVRRILPKALDTSHALPSLVSVIGFPAVLARPGSVVVEVKFLDTEHLPHLEGRNSMTKGNAQRLQEPLHVVLAQGEVSVGVVLIGDSSSMLNAIPPLTAKVLRLYANSG